MTGLTPKKLSLPLAIILLCAIPFLIARSVPVTGTPILEVHSGSLTTRLVGPTSVQDVAPLVQQRGVGIDGSLRAAPTFPMHLNGNPFGSPWTANQQVNGVSLATGTYAPLDVDLSIPAKGFMWPIARSYGARQEDAGHHVADGYQGKNWFQMSQPEILLFEHGSDAAEDVLYLIYGADRFVEFQRVDAESTEFKAKNGAAGAFQYTEVAEEPDLYAYTDQWGYEFTFFGFDEDSGPAEGQLWKIESPAEDVAYVGDDSDAGDAITNGFDASGRIEVAYDASNQRFTYTYATYSSVTRLQSVVAEEDTSVGHDWSSTDELGMVEYDYYGDESYGEPGDLKTVTVTTPLTDSGVSQTKTKLYRYYEGAFNASTNPGHEHAIKYVIDFEGVRRYDWLDQDFDDDHLGASNASLEPYASAYFEYDSSHRVDEAWFNGACGCGGGANGTHEFEYESSGYTNDAGYDQEWATRTIVKRPDGSYLTQHFDEAAQSLHEVITDDDPDNDDPVPNTWATTVARNTDGVIERVATPASLDTYTHATGAASVEPDAGLVYLYELVASGETKGFTSDRIWKQGGDVDEDPEYLDGSWTYTTATKAVGDVTVVRPLLASEREYTQAITSGTTGSNLTSYGYTMYSSTLMPEEVATTFPTVSASNNGSDGPTTKKERFTKVGLKNWELAEDGIITFWKYGKTLVTKVINDADTSQTQGGQEFEFDPVPGGYVSPNGPVHRKDLHTNDKQGRQTEVETADGDIEKVYFSRLADQRLVTLRYANYEDTPKFYGPVQMTVTNHAGQTEVQATVGLSGNESTSALTAHVDEGDDDPITAADLGSVEKMIVYLFDESGQQMQERRLYFSIPGSGLGADGTNYDPTLYGYDDVGNEARVKEPSGTIRRTEYDIHRQVVERWIGTNDASFDGGESSGTDNMVKVEALEFDGGGAGGNGYLTERTLYVEDGDTDKRVTTYTNDIRGNVLLETNPTAPHAFYKYDNLNRRTHTALYSVTTSIVAATDNPYTETDNRLAMTVDAYDERGRVWLHARYKIDQDDGSNDDHLDAKKWFDAIGRLIKEDGEQLRKIKYDRLGRQTHEFVLAVDDDADYEDLYGPPDEGDPSETLLDGDIVLVERQTTYESEDSDLVLMEAVIERFHDDFDTGASETTGPLDTDADDDPLEYTAADLEGRIQIRAMWYDAVDRLEDEVLYGTYGGSDFDRDSLSVPARSDTALRTTYVYNTDGTEKSVTDPRGLETRYEYDAAGRQTKQIDNYVDGTPGTGDDDRSVTYTYVDGLRTTITADLPAGETDQTTTYTFGTAGGGATGDSEIATGHLLQKVQYPDSAGGTDVVTYAYNAQSQRIYNKDQAGNVIQTGFDDSGRVEHRRVTTLDGDFDGAVRRISTAYDGLGRRSTVTQYDNAAVGSGSATDGVKFTYEDWGSIEKFEQDNNSEVGASGSVDDYEVSYTYEKNTDGRDTVRRASMTLPSGNVINYQYRSTAGRHDDDASRVTQVNDGTTALALYKYNGLGTVVATDYLTADVMREHHGSTSGSFPALDRFNRVVEDKWVKDLGTDRALYHVDLTYDRNSNVLSVDDHVHDGFDVKYTIDDLNRLTKAEEGTLSGGSITSKTREQEWALTQTGNWDVAKLDLDGDGNYAGTDEHNDDRTHNAVNELTARDTDDNGSDNFSLSYDEAGNLVDDDEDYEYEYDAFYRLRKLKNQSSALVAEYRYDGLGHRIAIHQDTDDDQDVDGSDDWHHFANDERWRETALFVGSDSTPTEEFIYHAAGADGFGGSSYIDELIRRDRDTDANGSLDELDYYCQNGHHDVVAIYDDVLDKQVEMVRYSAYGVPFGLAGGDMDSDGDCDSTDVAAITALVGSGYDVRADLDLDGVVDSSDVSVGTNDYEGTSLGRQVLSGANGRRGYAGYATDLGVVSLMHVRHRALSSLLGRWVRRDPIRYSGGFNLYGYAAERPLVFLDSLGLAPLGLGGGRCLPVCQVARAPGGPGVQFVIDVIATQPLGVGGLDSFGGQPCGSSLPDSRTACRLKLLYDLSEPIGDRYRQILENDGLTLDERRTLYYWHGVERTRQLYWTAPGAQVTQPGDLHASEKVIKGPRLRCGESRIRTVTLERGPDHGTALAPVSGWPDWQDSLQVDVVFSSRCSLDDRPQYR